MAKGEIIVEGAKCFCSNSVKNNSKATAVPLAVKSQIKKLKANKYFAQEQPIATNLDDTAESFNNGEGFGDCYLPDKSKKPMPCKAKCNIKYKDFYKNVDFDKSMKVLLDISKGTCPGYGTPGNIEFATTGQKKAVNTIDVKEADSFTVENTSAQWETADPTKEDSVSEINIIVPFAEKPTGKYYFIEKAKNTNIWPLTMPVAEAKLQLKAIYKGDPTKITWALFKGDEVKDKVKTFVGIGANIVFTLDKLFKDLDEGVYRIEAYANRAGYKDCAILIEYIKDHVEGITTPGNTLLKNTPIPLTLKFKASSLVEKQKILNPASLNTVYETSPIASWRVTCKNVVIFNSQISSESNLIKVETKTGALGIFTFKNPDEYQVEAYTSPNDTSPIKITLKVLESLGVNTVKGTCNQLLRYNESLKVEVSKFNVEFLPTNNTKMQWYLQKDGIRLTAFENAAISKEKSINKPINQILYYDAHGGNNYFGKYAIEGYGKPTNRPLFNASDSFFFEVIRNSIDKVTLPKSIPKGAKVKIETAARIMPLIGDEKINLELPNGVVDNHDGTITFNSEGEFEIAAYLTGEETLDTRVKTKIKVATPELKRALWSYGTGYKRTETGYKEETHAFVEIAGLENQSITIKVWVRGARESFYLEPATYMLEEKKITLNDKGIGSFKIITDDKYKDKIKKAVPATTEVPNPNVSLIFTVEMPTGSQGEITLPNDMAIKNGKPVVGTKFIEVLDSNEELAVTNEKKIKSIFFAKEDGKGVQQTLTHHDKSHKIWVHTVNMQEEELRVDVMSLVNSDCMEEKNGIITALQSIQEYKEKVGSDGLLELPFTAEEKYLTDAEVNPVRFSIQVSRKVKDPNDDKKEVYVFEDDQLATMPYANASLVRSPDMKTIGIKATKQDETTFTKEEKIVLRKKLICFKNTALIVAKGILTEEAIDNCTVPVVVDLEMAEVEKKDQNGICEAEARVRAFMRMLRVGEGTGELIKSYDKKEKKTVYITHDFQKGYSTAFNNNEITDFSKHPEKNYGGSTAAGAYQIMRYTWWWLNGEELDEDNNKTGVYKAGHDYVKKYSIKDYNSESQDKLCLILMKAQRSKLIGNIIKNEIETAIRKDACFIWASLPEVNDNSHYLYKEKPQPATPMEKCVEHYNKFLKEELLGISNLHLKKGFLKELGYDCCDGQNINSQSTGCGDKKDIDLRDQMIFQAQQTRTDCNLTCRKIMSSLNIVPENPTEPGNQSYYQTSIESSDNKKLILNNNDFLNGMKYIDSSLEAGYPIMVGVNHTLNYGYNESPNTSDHYVIIVGRFCDNKVLKYRFWDVATKRGSEEDFKFTLTSEKLYSDEVWKKERSYTLTQVRRNINSKGKLIEY